MLFLLLNYIRHSERPLHPSLPTSLLPANRSAESGRERQGDGRGGERQEEAEERGGKGRRVREREEMKAEAEEGGWKGRIAS